MAFTLTGEHRALQQMAREFAEKEIRPISAERDLIPDPRKTFCWDIIRKGSALGLRILAVPERLSGPGVDLLGQVLVALELARADGAICKTFTQCWKFCRFRTEVANDEQRGRFLPAFHEGRHLSAGLGEHGALGGLGQPHAAPGRSQGGLQDTGRPGRRRLAPERHEALHRQRRGGQALHREHPHRRSNVPIARGTTMFFVPADTPGLRIGRTHDKVGWRFYQNAELIFEDRRVPDANRLGEVNKGKSVARERVMGFNDVELPVNILGVAQAAFEHALEHARNRVQGSRPIIGHQAIQLKLADMYMRLEAARSYLFRMVEDTHGESAKFDSASRQLMKVFATEAGQKVTRDAVEIFGGMGVIREAPVEKLMRDASVFTHLAAGSVNTLMAAAKLR